MKRIKKENNVKDGNEEDLERSNIPGMHKRSRIKDTINPDLTVSMKAARIERQRVKMLKPQLLSEKKCKDKRQSAVEDIFKDIDANNDVVYTEEYSSSEESLSSNSEEASLNINNYSQLRNYKKGHVLRNGNCLFASLYKLVFNDSFGTFQHRQLIVDHIKDNKDLYADDIEGDFDDYIQNMKNNGEWGGIVELLPFSSMIDIRIDLWTDINDSAPYLTIGYSNNQNVIKLLYSNWFHYSSLIPSSNNNLITRKNKLIKGKKYRSCQRYCLKIQESHWVNQKCMNWY